MRFHKLALASVALLTLGVFDSDLASAVTPVNADEALPNAEEETLEETPYQPPENTEEFKFQAEVNRMLDIVVNSLYQNKDVFLRELISNASDAIDKIRFMALTKPELMDEKKEMEIRIEYDSDANTVTITDSGIGMSKEDLVKNLGTVARSGTTKFLENIGEGKADIGMIGQFGVGFYSSFLVADKVTVASSPSGDERQYLWETVNGASEFYVGDDPRGNTLGRGTEIKLTLKEDAMEYADPRRLKDLIGHYSEFVQHPIYLRTTSVVQVPDEDEDVDDDEKDKEKDDEEDVEKAEKNEGDELDVEDEDMEEEEKEQKMKDVIKHSWDKVNQEGVIWNRSKDDITDDEYQDFFKTISKEPHDAALWNHFVAEGSINFKSIIYLPNEIPPALTSGRYDDLPMGLKLYVRKVLISDEFELLPKYLGFIKGIVDSDDLPLNVNRETLQESNIIKIISKKLVRKVIETLRKFATDEKLDEDKEELDPELKNDEELDPELKKDDDDEDDDEDEVHPYIQWYEKFNPSLKLGVMDDDANRSKLAKLLRYKTSKSDGKYVSLDAYVAGMKEWQTDIYYMAGDSIKEIENSQFMEKFLSKDIEVLYFTEPVDEYMVGHLREFDDKKLVAITKENIKFKDEDADMKKRREKVYKAQFKPLTKWLNKLYGSAVMRVSLTDRLESAPAIVSSSEYGHSANMEKMMRAQAFQHGKNLDSNKAMRILEINPRHPFILKLLDSAPGEDEEEEDKEIDQAVTDAAFSLLDMALINGGFSLDDGKSYTNRMMRVVQNQLSVDSLELAEEIYPEEEEEEEKDVEFDMGGTDGINLDDFDDMDMGDEL